MDIERIYNIIHKIADGFEEACIRCLENNSRIVLHTITEQMWCGIDGEGNHLKPTYDDDDFFNEEGEWYHRSQDYKAWKRAITPPVKSTVLCLPARPDNVPNLYINGKFYSELTATRQGNILYIDPGVGNGPDIVEKYKEGILRMGTVAVEFFNTSYLLPDIEAFFHDCGYK